MTILSRLLTFLNLTLKLPLFQIMSDLANIAISAALGSNWEKAVTTNKDIIADNPNDINALNRLAFAYIQICKVEDARKVYKKILAIDKYNLIAIKNLTKINNSHTKKSAKRVSKRCPSAISPSLFIEEPGKTKTITLTNPAPYEVLSNVNIGDAVNLHSKKHSIEIRDLNNIYLGALPDDIAFRLLRLLKSGNTYRVNIKNIAKNNITVFMCELKRGKRFSNQPSFLTAYSQRSNLTPVQAKNNQEDTDNEEDQKPSQEDEE